MKMETTIPTELLDLKTRLDQWRANRKYLRQPMPAELRQAAVAISQRYPGALVRRVLNLDPWRLNRAASKNKMPTSTTARQKQPPTFFRLPTDAVLPTPVSAATVGADCRLQIERPDGARLTLTLPGLDFVSIHRLATDFLRGDKP